MTIASLDKMLKNIPSLKVLSSPQDYVFPKQMFFDTVYHLTREGREIRSIGIAKQLEPVIRDTTVQSLH